MADMSEMGSRIGEQVGHRAGEVLESGRNRMAEMTQKARDYGQQGYDLAAEKTRQLKTTTEHYVQENPWYAIGIAAGAGILVGILLRSAMASRE